jgi:hypothetical protein
MWARLAFGVLFACGYVVLVYDLVAIGKTREARVEKALAAAGS